MNKSLLLIYILCYSCFSSIGKEIDFTVKNLHVSANTVYPSSYVTYNFNWKNLGDSIITPTYTIVISTDSTPDLGDVVAGESLAFGELGSGWFNIPVSLSPGKYYVIATIDHSNTYSEKNETNNSTFFAIEIVPYNYDLSLVSVQLQKNKQYPATSSTAALFTKNTGITPSANSTLKIYLSKDNLIGEDDVLITSKSNGQTVTSLAVISTFANSSINKTEISYDIPDNILAGTYNLIFVVNAMHENNKDSSNNSLQTVLTILPTTVPDLVLENLIFSSDSVQTLSRTFNYSFDIRNGGKGPMKNIKLVQKISSKDTSFTISSNGNISVDGDSVLNINTTFFLGYARTHPLTYSLKPGIYKVEITTEGLPLETELSNNSIAKNFTVIPTQYNLEIVGQSVLPFKNGQGITATTEIVNNGKMDLNAGKIYHYVSTDTILDPSDFSFYVSYDLSGHTFGLKSGSKMTDIANYLYTLPGKYFLFTLITEYDGGFGPMPGTKIISKTYVPFELYAAENKLRILKNFELPDVLYKNTNYQSTAFFNITPFTNTLNPLFISYLSTDTVVDPSDYKLATVVPTAYQGIYEIPEAGKDSINLTFIIPTSVPEGFYYIINKFNTPSDDPAQNAVLKKVLVKNSDRILLFDKLNAQYVSGTKDSIVTSYSSTSSGNAIDDGVIKYYYSPDSIFSVDDQLLFSDTLNFLTSQTIEMNRKIRADIVTKYSFKSILDPMYLILVEIKTYVSVAFKKIEDFKTPLAVMEPDYNSGHIFLYPNPVQESINIGGIDQGNIEIIEIRNISGALVISSNKSLNKINVQTLQPGLYLLKVIAKEKTSILRFIKI